jgi:hypothetical protein
MARVAASPAFIRQHDYTHIIDWYRETLPTVPPPRQFQWEPIRIGPTWDWDIKRGWLLPEHSMGWELLGWTGYWLRDNQGQDWQWTPEQARFLLWYHSLDVTGRLLFRTAVLQRMKGHGKDPLACGEASAHAFAPIVFDHWGSDGQPVGRENTDAWVQIAAVSKDQTANTMKLFATMLSPEARAHYGIQIGRQNVWGLGDTRQIQATAANFLAIEGKRVTEAIRNEPQNWNGSNRGHETAGAIDGNSTKIPAGMGRVLDIENAFRPGEDSVAERVRQAWEDTQATATTKPKARAFGMLMDSLEAHPDAPLTADAAPEIIESVRGDSIWLDIPAIVESILNGSNTPSESRRKWYNQIVASADAWASPQEFDGCYRDESPAKGDAIFIFGDGSKSDDHTAAVGCRVSDGMVFPVGIWVPEQIKEGDRTISLPIDRAKVDHTIRWWLDNYDVYGLWWDPSDARDEETGERYWEPYCDAWAADHPELRRFPAVKTGIGQHAVIWDMRNPLHLKQFTENCGRTLQDIKDKSMFHNCPQPHVGGPGVRMRQHVINMRRRPNKFGVAVGKQHRESRLKVDAGVCMIGARMMWHQSNGQGQNRRAPGTGAVVTLQ